MSTFRALRPVAGSAAVAALAVVVTACGDDPPAASDTTPALGLPAPDDGGFGAPASAPGEFGRLPGIAMTGTARLEPTGCWYLSGNGESALLVAPAGTRLGGDGATLVTAEGAVIEDGATLDASGGLVDLGELPGGPDGRWADYAAFCAPRYGFAVVADTLATGFDPGAVDPDALADELDGSLFDTDHGCGFGFATGDTAGTWALRIEITTGSPPAAGRVVLPDDRFDVTVTSGAHLFSNHCDDVMEWFEPVPTPAVEWEVTAGEFEYPATSGDVCAGGPPETITLAGATVRTPAGAVPMDPIEITNDAFGCFAG